ncbi:MAG: aminotransferase class III-fold pyridoxal phosphate-dependent enzyme, partial [Calditrichaeota bacterium]
MERKRAAVPHGAITNIPVFIKKADNFLLTDVDDNVFIDFGAGIGVINVGHANDKVVEAISEQAHKFTHTCFHMAMYESYVQVAEKLNKYTPGDSQKKTYLINSGAEAIENAVKIARRYTGKSAIVAFEHAFHGRTLLGLTLTGKVSPYREGFGPMAPEIYHLPSPHRPNIHTLSHRKPSEYTADFIAEQLKTVVPVSDIAAFIIEPVLGEGGVLPIDTSYLQALVTFAHDHNILLIADEI